MTKNRKSKKSNKRSFKRSLRRSFKRFKKSLKKSERLLERARLRSRPTPSQAASRARARARQKARARAREKARGLKKKYNIVDVPLDKKENKGTVESSGFVDYHYQRLDNISNFLSKISKSLNNVYTHNNLTIEYDIETHKIISLYSSLEKFTEKIKKKKDTHFIAVTFNVQLLTFSHANILLIDNVNKNIELFEPHGYKDEDSTLEGIKGAYFQKVIYLKKFIKKILPGYNFKDVTGMFKKEGFQMKYDARRGYCVTWSILYVHYRLLNPNIKLDVIIQYIYYCITKNKLLRYAKYIETILKKI